MADGLTKKRITLAEHRLPDGEKKKKKNWKKNWKMGRGEPSLHQCAGGRIPCFVILV